MTSESGVKDREKVLILDGVRTPLCKAGTDLAGWNAVELGRMAFRAVLDRTGLDPGVFDEVIVGCVGQPSEAQNVARAVALAAGVPRSVPAVTVHRNCASGFEAITTAAERIRLGRGQIYLVGGTESMSNYPLLYSKSFTDWFALFAKAKSPAEKLAALVRFRPGMLKPRIGVVEGLTDYSCGIIMGKTAENLAVDFSISRREQDEFALMSHQRAIAARERLAEEISPVPSADFSKWIDQDNGPRENQSMEALGKLRPYFDRTAGTVTVGNACPITDGAAAMIVLSESRCRSLGLQAKGRLLDWKYAGLDPHRMGLGPVFATARLLEATNLRLSDFDLVELNEAFAAQVIACERAFASKEFAERELGRSLPLGTLDRERLNVNGGAIALGHPVGMTGTRLVLTLLEELRRREKTLGLATLCIGGGQGGAVAVERI